MDKAQQNPGQKSGLVLTSMEPDIFMMLFSTTKNHPWLLFLNTSTEATVVVVVVGTTVVVVVIGAVVVVPSQYPQVAWQFAITFDFEHFPLLSLLAHFVEVQISSHASVAAARLAKRDSRM